MNKFFVLIIVFALSFGSNNASKLFPKNKVIIKNSLNRSDDILTIHCISDQDDLGIHLVRRSDLYIFKFGDNFFGGTKFDCKLSHGVGFKSSVTFTAYKEDPYFYIKFGDFTFWDAREDGIYLSNEYYHEKFMYSW
ncbi:PREDICTED: pumilio homolog 15-like [Camelina sativa]|uniref:S-protein homolog n=1 Tax=Camelina sativa TaxID=90675 RepID=A0ABM0WF67_CAMSA|nr:PREDICTED: pumilio homolog 15-like [Camelina sativa]